MFICIFQQDSLSAQDMLSWASLPPTHHKDKPVYSRPWLLCFTTSVSPGVQQSCWRPQTVHSTWLQLLRQDSGQAIRWPLSVPSVAVGFSIAPRQWCSWSAWHLPSWLEMWSRLLFLCKQGNREHHRDTWKVNVVNHFTIQTFSFRHFIQENVNQCWYTYVFQW